MNLKVNQKVVSKESDEQAIQQAFATLPPDKQARVELRRGTGDVLHVVGRPSKGYQLMWQAPGGDILFSRRGDVDRETAVFTLTLYAQSSPEWQGLVDWLPPNVSRYFGNNPIMKALSTMPPGLGALLIFGTIYTIFAVYVILTPEKSGFGQSFGLQEILGGFVVIGVLAAYVQYIEFFFSVLRPRMANWLSQRLGVQIEEDMSDAGWLGGAGPGTWDASGGSMGNRFLLQLFDLLLLVGGVVGPLAVFSISAFLIFDR